MSAEEVDDRVLVERARAGDEDAAREVIQMLHPIVLRSVRAHRPRRVAEEDLVQTVFMKVFAHLEQYSGRVPLAHWVSRIAVNTCRHQLAYERVRPELRWADLDEEQESVVRALAETDAALPEVQALAARELVDRLLASLAPEDRLVVSLLHIEGRSVEEVRALTGWSRALVKVRAFRARQKMKRMLANLLKGDVS